MKVGNRYHFKHERDFSKWFRNKLMEEFGDHIVIVNHTATGYGASGVSDLLFCFYGFFFAAELKMNGRDLSKLQEQFAMRVARAGGRTLMPVTPNPRVDEDGKEYGGADAAIDYLRQLANLIQMRRNVQELNEEEAQHVVDETYRRMAEEYMASEAAAEALVEGELIMDDESEVGGHA